jgi:acyl dehydratase
MNTNSMGKPSELIFRKQPSMITTALLALLNRNSKFDVAEPFPQITAHQNTVTIDRKKLSEFNRICGIKASNKLPVIYPFALIYPLLQRIFAQKDAPLSLFVVLNNRMQVLQHRAIGIEETLDITSSITGHRIREKGLEMDIASVVKSSGITAWENIQTFYYRGQFGAPDENYQPPHCEDIPIPDAAETARWFLPAGIGHRFSKVCGDGNPIHYWKTYAHLLGFKRDFAQPLLVIGGALTHLLKSDEEGSVSLDISLKGPVYYENTVILKSTVLNGSKRFDILCGDNPLPSICGSETQISKA